MKLKEVIPFIDLKQTFVYVPNTLIEQMPKLNKQDSRVRGYNLRRPISMLKA